MFWLQVSTLVLVNVLIASMLFVRPPRAAHGRAGDGALSVWQLIEQVETERQRQAASNGRHHISPETLARLQI
ncbi:hypothetical protein SAMN05421805_103446 [Saccharopolyspora antimicrobica]|uniref:Uncharacterized protein n=1 Tax=Saccharopolyspora antimicrobica TaxID=455193 RepID=A0A1I4XJ73_9PSEU|nr:hypothetical protein [Saccharopolyspora antimicrobica]RKT84512.1 hypothetical protein ATL45_2830 [Saccharopolyspora antimicrobica]SFN25270.1 hypothetical protein SAMN05421805_103446 [Saccharopolyspora antimicrobica]